MNYYSNVISENKYTDFIFKWVVDVIIVIMFALFFVTVIAHKEKVDGSSMSPTFETGDEVLVNELSFGILSPSRFDVIAFNVGDQTYLKRVIGLPGETLQIIDGNVYINGEKITFKAKSDPIVSPGLAQDKITLGENEYFVLGDNWNNSEDSRFSYIGNVNKKEIIGKAWFILSPFSNLGFIADSI